MKCLSIMKQGEKKGVKKGTIANKTQCENGFKAQKARKVKKNRKKRLIG